MSEIGGPGRAGRFTRRQTLIAGVAIAGVTPALTAARTQPDVERLNARWADMTLGASWLREPSPIMAERLAQLSARADSLRRTWRATTPKLWDDLASRDAELATRLMAERVRTLTLAHSTPGAAGYADPVLLDLIVGSLERIRADRYNAGATPIGNWWEWEIGIPLHLLDILIVLRRVLEPRLVQDLAAAVHRFSPDPWKGTGANRAWISNVVMLRASLTGDAAGLGEAVRAFPDAYAVVESGDGFHADGSFIQHDVFPYTGAYGQSLVQRASLVAYWLHGSPFAVPEPALRDLCDRLPTAFEPLMYRGAMMDMARGRAISRAHASDVWAGQAVIQAALLLGAIDPRPDLRILAKSWLKARPTPVAAADGDLPLYVGGLLDAALANPSVPDRPERTGLFAFAGMDRLVYRRPGFAVGLALNSARTGAFESINAENLRGWHTAQGMTAFYDASHPNFADGYWPTADPHRLPGVTAARRARIDGDMESVRNRDHRVGMVALEDCGAACMAVSRDGGGFTARCSWVFFGDAMIALGTDIADGSGAPVETTIESRNLGEAGEMRLTTPDAQVRDIEAGRTVSLHDVPWLHLGGYGGVVVLGTSAVSATCDARTGAWTDISRYGGTPTAPITRKYATLWIDHGSGPTDGRYAYVTLPGASPERTAEVARTPPVVKAETTLHAASWRGDCQAFHAAVFWEAHGGVTHVIAADGPVAVVARQAGETLDLAVSDPSQQLGRLVSIRVQIEGGEVVSLHPSLTVEASGPSITLTFDPTGLRGRSAKATVRIPPEGQGA